MHGSRIAMVVSLCTVMAGGCVTASHNPEPAPRVAVVLAGAPATRYGADARQVFDNPALRTKIRALFGPDWTSTSVSGLSAPISAYFTQLSAPTQLRIDGLDWVALSGCMPGACGTRHGLLLIGPGSDQLLARIDDGGFTREYAYGPFQPRDRAVVEAAWRALAVKAAGGVRALSWGAAAEPIEQAGQACGRRARRASRRSS